MNKKVAVGLLVILVVVGLFIAAPDSKKNDTATVNKTALTMKSIQADISSGSQLVDVRTAEEYAAGHIESAVNVSLQDIQQGTMPSVPKDKKVYVYCHSGNRSGQATKLLEDAGFTNVVDLGAITHVEELGGVVVKS